MIKDNVETVVKDDIEIRVVREKCIGAATCTVYAPATFDLDEQNIAIIKNGEWDRLEKIVAAAVSCPVLAIEVYEKGKKLFPKT
jgi:ferredoxin